MLVALTVVGFFVACICTFFAVYAKGASFESRTTATVVSGFAGLIGVICLITASLVVVDAGKVGVKVLFGKVDPTPLQSGLHVVNPICFVEELSIQSNNYWMSHQPHEGQKNFGDAVDVTSKNGLKMPVDVSCMYRLLPDTAPWVYENLGTNYVEKLLRPALAAAARRSGSKHEAEHLYSTERDEFSEGIKSLLEEELNKVLVENYAGANPPKNVLMISQVLVGHIEIPDKVKNAIESKLQADQEQQAMQFTIMKAEQEAKRKQIEANGIQKFQEIVSKGIDENLLKWKGIEATLKLAESPNTKIVIMGNGKGDLPVILNSDK